MNRQKLVVIGQGSDFHRLDVHSRLPTAMASGALSTRRINKDMPHGLCGGSEEMSAPGKLAWLVLGERSQLAGIACPGMEQVGMFVSDPNVYVPPEGQWNVSLTRRYGRICSAVTLSLALSLFSNAYC